VLVEDGLKEDDPKIIELRKQISGNFGKIQWDAVSSTYIATFDQLKVSVSGYDDFVGGKWIKHTIKAFVMRSLIFIGYWNKDGDKKCLFVQKFPIDVKSNSGQLSMLACFSPLITFLFVILAYLILSFVFARSCFVSLAFVPRCVCSSCSSFSLLDCKDVSISYFIPGSGIADTENELAITGTGFLSPCIVFFAGTAGAVIQQEPFWLRCQTPAMASGTLASLLSSVAFYFLTFSCFCCFAFYFLIFHVFVVDLVFSDP
jgi:hypothetical protein